MNGTIDIAQFASFLKSEGLLIVSRSDYEQKIDFEAVKLRNLQDRLLSKDYLDFREILDGRLLPITSRQSINNWIDNGTFKDGEYFKSSDDGRKKIVVEAIKRVRKLKNYE